MSKNNLIDVVIMDEPEEMEYHYGYNNAREKDKIVKRIEKSIRQSMEYRDYISFLKDNIGMDACAFFNNINKDSSKGIRIEVHHEPLRLYDIVNIILKKYEDTGIPINDLMIAKESMEVHYKNLIGLIPLSKTLHEVVHNSDKLVIPAYMIYGDYKKFIEEYGDYMDDNQISKIERMLERTKDLKADSFKVLEQKYTYIEVDGFTIPTKLDKEEKEDESLTA